MNTKTTLLLAAAFVGLVGGYFLFRSEPVRSSTKTEEPPKYLDDTIERDLVPEKLEDLTKVVVRRKGDDREWVFVREENKDDASGFTWRMTSPLETKIAAWEGEKFNSQLVKAKYKVSFKPGEADAKSLADAGLDQPEMTVTVTDKQNKSATFHIGGSAGNNQSYVRVGASAEVALVNVKADDLLKQKAYEYRDPQFWSVPADKVTKLEIVERAAGGTVTYAFRRDGANWTMESPAAARATAKVGEAVNVLSRIRSIKWIDDRADKLALYGLQEPALTLKMTVMEPVAPTKEDTPGDEGEAEPKPAEPQTKETTYVLHLSDRSPIGDETKVYVRADDESTVGAIARTNSDKLRPVMADWRDMRLTTANVRSATRVEITTKAGVSTFVKNGAAWFFEGGSQPAERQAVEDVLTAVNDLKATVFSEMSGDAAQYGFDDPQARVTLTIPGADGPERIVVGAYTDAASKRLVYVRRNESTSVAKVRAQDVSRLLRGPETYRDLTIFNMPAAGIHRVTIDRENRFADGRQVLTYSKEGGAWSMVEPAQAELKAEAVTAFVSELAALRATAVAPESGGASAYGLDAPTATITFVQTLPKQFRMEEAKDESGTADSADTAQSAEGEKGKEPKKLTPVEFQPPDETHTLLLAEHGGRWYAKRGGSPTVYEIAKTFGDSALAEHRAERVLSFDEKAVRRISVRQGETTHVFEKTGAAWQYATEPDWPLDGKKVDNLVLQVRDLKTSRYAAMNVSSWDAFGLTAPFREVRIETDAGPTIVLQVSEAVCPGDPGQGRYARVDGRNEVFLLAPDAIKLLTLSLDEFEKK